jgi:Uma2 family endonuclease
MTTTIPRQKQQQSVIRTPGSYADYLAWPVESRLVEWKDGEIIEYMPASDRHQALILFLSTLLNLYIKALALGELRFAPLEVKLWPDGPSREPDILFVANERVAQLTDKRYLGGPDMVVEVISTSSARIDRVEKFIEYEQAGVREYWLIDPRPRQQQAEFYQRGADGRFLSAPLNEDGFYRSAVLPGFWLNPDWLRAEKLPPPALIMAEIAKDVAALPDDVRAAYRALYDALNL